MKASTAVDSESRSWLGSRWERMSSGLKMFLIMSLGLLPLGIVAVAASIYSATENSEQRAEQTLARLDIKAQRLNELLDRVGQVQRDQQQLARRTARQAEAPAPPENPAVTIGRRTDNLRAALTKAVAVGKSR